MDTNSNSKTNVGVLLVGHGSRLPYGKDVVSQIAEIYRENTNYLVEIGFMNMSKPSIPTAINNLADKGVNKIIVTPVFLAHGVHTKQDIPRILGLDNGHEDQGHSHPENQEHGHDHKHSHHDQEVEEIQFKGEIIYTEPLGADKRIADIIKDRVDNAL
jgi:Uncharacterized conserved protein